MSNPTAPPAYDQIDRTTRPLQPTAPVDSVDRKEGEDEIVDLSAPSAAPHLPGFPRREHGVEENLDQPLPPPPYQLQQLQIDETEEARRLEIERDVLEMRLARERREAREARERLARERTRTNYFWTGVIAGEAAASMSHHHHHHHHHSNHHSSTNNNSSDNSSGVAAIICIGCLFCGVIGSCFMGAYLCNHGCKKRDKTDYRDEKLYRAYYIMGAIFFMFILPAAIIYGLVVFFQHNPDIFKNSDNTPAPTYYPWNH